MVDPHDPEAIFLKLLEDQARTHISREIQVNAPFLPNRRPATASEAEDVIAIGRTEFDVLRRMGLEVPAIEWCISESSTSMKPVILARLPIIDGKHFATLKGYGSHLPQNESLRVEQLVLRYTYMERLQGSRGYFLNDIDGIHQYVYGNYRNPEVVGSWIAEQAVLVDPDLVFHKLLPRVA